MYLKKIKLIGFKSFADRTEFELDNKLTAVVGPNGCGKSNLVDALLWAMGEPSSKALRAASSADIIFNGSKQRKPLGMSEVTLTFDNEDRRIPLDVAEIAVTRKAYRDGDSEYQINKQTCRLKDIYDLFADTGIGRTGYSIITQQEVDKLLNASPEERRVYLDEVAGVQKYRVRKNEAIRRLATAGLNLQRAEDVIKELDKEREPLQIEADKARMYKTLTEQLRSIEVGFLSKEIKEAMDTADKLNRQLNELREVSQQQDLDITQSDSQSDEIGKKLAVIESETDTQRMQLYSSVTAFERAESRVALVEQREKSINELAATLKAESETFDAKAEELEADAAKLVKQREHLEAETPKNQTITELKAKQTELEKELAETDNQLRQITKEQLRYEQNAAEYIKAKERLAQMDSELKEAEQHIKESETAVKNVTFIRDETANLLAAKQDELSDIRYHLKMVEDNLSQLNQQMNDIDRKISATDGRLNALKQVEENFEGYPPGTKFILTAAKTGALRGRYVTVADSIQVKEEYLTAIEAALGGSLQDILTSSSERTEAAIDLLKRNKAGKVTFWPLDLLEPTSPSTAFERLMDEQGVVGAGDKLVECEQGTRGVIQILLGRTLVTYSLKDALRIAHDFRNAGWSKIVTLDGEVITGRGSVTGGTYQQKRNSVLQRQTEIRQLQTDLDQLTVERKELEDSLSMASAGQKERKENENSIFHKVEEARNSIMQKEKILGTTEQELKQAQKRFADLTQERQTLLENSAKQPELPSLESANKVAAVRAEYRVKLDEILKQLAVVETEENERLRRIKELNDRAQTEQKAVADARLSAGAKRERLGELIKEREQLDKERADAYSKREEAMNIQARLEAAINNLTEKRQALLNQSYIVQEQKKDLAVKRSSLERELRETELALARCEVKRTQIVQKLIEEYNMTVGDALNSDAVEKLPQDASAQANRARREMKALGDVNLGAIDAYERVNRRWVELNTQRDDLIAAKDELELSVKEIDRNTRARSNEAIIKVQEMFQKVFEKFFESGTAIIQWTKPDNLLESGVDLWVQLPGKRRQPLDALSGGERSLTALAFLLGLMDVKPSPLCVLDEVDAALDGRNIERFVAVMKEYSTKSQFLVVTHNPTTIEAADIWYGVTMTDPGVSRIIPYSLPRAEALVSLPVPDHSANLFSPVAE